MMPQDLPPSADEIGTPRTLPAACFKAGDSFSHGGSRVTVAKVRYSEPVGGRLVIVDTDGREWRFSAIARLGYLPREDSTA